MTVSEFFSQRMRHRLQSRVLRLRSATFIAIAIVVLGAGVAIAWFAGEGIVSELFAHLAEFQANPPQWLQPPMSLRERHFLLLALMLWGVVISVTKISPQPKGWARYVVVGVLMVLTMRYIMWRALSTLNLRDPLNGTFSLLLFFLEMLMLSSGTIQLFLMLNVRDRSPQANRLQPAVIAGSYRPSVDILVPSYNEPEFILRRTLIGCQAIAYEPKTIYLLDDTRRQHIRKLAEELGCQYITRSDNEHAKAGNLNHALPLTHGELIAVFDADFIPTRNFLQRTVGFFQRDSVALVQTPQSFYNPDPIAHNLGLEDVLTPEEEVFYRQIQPIKDGAGSVVCSGTAFVVRRAALEAAGGFVTDSLSEDYFTGIRLSARGYHLVYLDEKLSAGLAAENIATHITQRIRWARGTLQAFFITSNPLTIPGLNPIQRLAHFEGLLHWFTSFTRIYFLLMPLAYSFLGVIPLETTIPEFLYFFVPYYLVQLAVFSWLNCQSRSALLSDIYAIVSAFPLALTVIEVMLRPFSKGFKVTPKGTSSKRVRFNWVLGAPLLVLFAATAVSLWRNLGVSMMYEVEGLSIGWVWSAYNLMMLWVSLLVLLDFPQPDSYQWYRLRRVVRLDIEGIEGWGYTTRISELGIEIALTQSHPVLDRPHGQSVALELAEEKLELQGRFVRSDLTQELPRVQIEFEGLTLDQQRRAIALIYCRPGQWLSRKSPGELQSLLLLFRILVRPRVLVDRKREPRAIAVGQL
ncbi:glycosyltransferase, probably involved in cell wall biogenesis [Rubidibacter lacunae KORDI 51-2]|uniref:Glycosyltransferase, probably involved in cell wall biogenesis n=1 Tax=Rubidibacter lacunae KORDI 51-2 TaxID=582515 RepID=U5DPT8_9CHRO|nr:cellulose synthase catalytic subunit [Rubidibacter lacunae]ERN41715.1 glycosyltransferase, probably involved in cell wall biogenesis [Rubidibacter lacunae KORDI 51-2]